MDIVKQILTEIMEGKKSFKPASDSQSDMEDFQSVAKIMIYADQQGWLNSFKVHREIRTANNWYDLILVQNGLSYEGKQYLQKMFADDNTNSPTQEDIIELKPNFMGLGVNLNALLRWCKKRNS